MHIARKFLVLGLLPLLSSSCAHYYLPANQLDTPETVGPGRIGRLEILGIQSGTDLVATPTPGSPDPVTGKSPDPSLQNSPANYVFGVWVGVTPQLDVGVRFEPYAPLIGRVKYQLMGAPESEAKTGNLSLSAGLSAGLLLANQAQGSLTFYTATGAILGGYRFGQHHVISLAPFFNLAGLSGTSSFSGSGTRFGGSLGYQYDIESLILRTELTWASGSFTQTTGPTNSGGFFPGVLFGFRL